MTADRSKWLAAAVAALLALGAALLWLRSAREARLELLDPAQLVVLRTPGGMLEVATLVKNEEFGWQSSYTCPPFDCAQVLGHTVSRIRVPVHYTYRIPLAETWELRLEGDRYVLALPPPEPRLPPAMDTARAQLRTEGSWTTPSRSETVEAMLRNIVPELNRRAMQPEYFAAQRASAEKTAEEFARKWMREQIRTPQRPVKVVFRDAGSG